MSILLRSKKDCLISLVLGRIEFRMQIFGLDITDATFWDRNISQEVVSVLQRCKSLRKI